MLRATLIGVVVLLSSPALRADMATSFSSQVAPVLAKRCVECHSGDKAEAKLDLSQPRSAEQLRSEMPRWFRVLQRVTEGSMPPKDAEPLSQAEKQAVIDWVRQDYSADLRQQQQLDGRSKLRRLSRSEYSHTILDLFGIRPPVMREFPSDGRVDGYDKVSAALPLSSANAEGYMKAAEGVLRNIFNDSATYDRKYRLWAKPSEQSAGHILELPDGTKVSFNTDMTSGPLAVKDEKGEFQARGTRLPGIHKLRMSIYAYQTDKPLTFGIYAGHIWAYPQLVELVKVLEAPPGTPTIVETEVYLRTQFDSDVPVSDGFRLVPFGLGVPVPKNTQASDCKGPGLAIQWVDVEEPPYPLPGDRFLSQEMPPEFAQKFLRPGANLANSQLSRDEVAAVMGPAFRRVGERLFRRELTDAEVTEILNRFLAQADAGVPLRNTLLDVVALLLATPDFFCVVERPGLLDDFALASRLSYLLWNSAPDETLWEVARQGKLRDAEVLRAQTDRMLNDPKSQRFVDNFLDQWLGLWGIDNTTPDKDLYPEFDDLLKMSSVLETRGTFRRMLDKNLSVREFVAPQTMLVNERLAAHYGLPPAPGFSLREVAAPADSPFGGLWTQAAVMKVTANGTLTSPVKRGVWMAERLLGTPIPPPPPNIEPVNPDTRGAKTLREQLALHSSQGSCRACHARFDPYGFALESFDVMGNYRRNYRQADPDFAKLDAAQQKGRVRWRDGLPVDCSGALPDGTSFADIQSLRRILAQQPQPLAHGFARHLLIYATGTPASPLDDLTISEIVAKSAEQDYGVRSLVHGVVQSELFRWK